MLQAREPHYCNTLWVGRVHRLVWAAPGRDRATVGKFFDDLGEQRSRLLTHVSADGADWIGYVVGKRAPNAIVARCDRIALATMLMQVLSGTLEGIRLANSAAGADVFLVRNGRGVRIARVGTEAVFAAASEAQVSALLEACSGRPLHVAVTHGLLTELTSALTQTVACHDELSPYAAQCLTHLAAAATGSTLPSELYWALDLYEIEAPSTDGHFIYDGHTGSWT